MADPAPGAAERVAGELGARCWYTDAAELIADPDVEAVVIAAPARPRRPGRRRRAAAGKAVFCREADGADPRRRRPRRSPRPRRPGCRCRSASTAASPPTSPRPAQVVADGGIGTPQLLRSLTRDPGLADPGAVPPWTIFTADADPRLRHPALVQPRRDAGRGLRHGRRPRRARLQGRRPARHRRGRRSASTTARSRSPRPASPPPTATTSAARSSARPAWSPPATPRAPRCAHYHAGGVAADDRARRRRPLPRRLRRASSPSSPPPSASGAPRRVDRRGRPRALWRSRWPASSRVRDRRARSPCATRTGGGAERPTGSAVHPGRLRGDGLPSTCPFVERVRRIHDARLPGRDLGLDEPRHRRARPRPGRTLLVDDRLRRRQPHRRRRRRRAARAPRPQSVRGRRAARHARGSTCTAPASTTRACRCGRSRWSPAGCG